MATFNDGTMINKGQLENWLEHRDRFIFRENNRNLYLTGQELDSNKIHFAMVGNSLINNYNEKDSLDPTNVTNPNTGATSVIWQNGNSYGVLCKEEGSGNYEYVKENNTYDVKNRKNTYNVDTSIPNIKLSSPFIWTGDNGRCCGFNYAPPNGTILALGMKDTGSPVMLTTLPSNPAALYPVLKSGEVSISGYGNNFIHWGQSDKITIFCGSHAGEVDLDDPDSPIDKNSAKKNVSDCELEIIVNANDRLISINAWEKPDKVTDDYNKCNKDARLPNGEQKTKIIISPNDVEIISQDTEGNETYYYQSSLKTIRRVKSNKGQSEEVIDEKGITINTDFDYTVNAKNIKMKSLEETYMSSDIYNIEVINNINTSTNDYNVQVNNEYKTKTRNYKVDTSNIYQLESKETILASTENTNIFSDDTMNIRVPGMGEYKREKTDGSTVNIDVHHTPNENTSSKHTPDSDKKFRINIDGCDVNIDNREKNHGIIIDSDDVG